MPIATPYDPRINRLRQRLNKGGGRRPKIRQRLQRQRGMRRQFRQAASTPTPIPYSSQYESDVGSAQNFLNQQLAGFAGQRLQTEQQFGFGTDQSNPYSIAKQLEANAAQQRARTQNQFARTGGLYSGALSRTKRFDAAQAGAEQDRQMRAYQQALAGIAQDELGARRDFDLSVSDAEAARLEAGLEEPVDPMEAPRGGGRRRRRRGGGRRPARRPAPRRRRRR